MLSEVDDRELLSRLRVGDEAALRELVERHSAWLLLRLRRRAAEEDLVRDALHDTFVAVWRNPTAYRGEGDVGAWLWGIAIRQLINRLRKRPGPTPISDRELKAVSPVVASAEDEMLVAVAHGALGDALKTLSPEFVRALQVTVVDGLTTREAAALLGIPQGTVKSRVRIAKSKLRGQLTPMEAW